MTTVSRNQKSSANASGFRGYLSRRSPSVPLVVTPRSTTRTNRHTQATQSSITEPESVADLAVENDDDMFDDDEVEEIPIQQAQPRSSVVHDDYGEVVPETQDEVEVAAGQTDFVAGNLGVHTDSNAVPTEPVSNAGTIGAGHAEPAGSASRASSPGVEIVAGSYRYRPQVNLRKAKSKGITMAAPAEKLKEDITGKKRDFSTFEVSGKENIAININIHDSTLNVPCFNLHLHTSSGLDASEPEVVQVGQHVKKQKRGA